MEIIALESCRQILVESSGDTLYMYNDIFHVSEHEVW